MIVSDRERQAPKTLQEVEPSHLARYEFALENIRSGSRVLDIPCGCGYGTALLAEKAAKVEGIDRDEGAVQHGQECFSGARLSFSVCDVADLQLKYKNERFDHIVSFEGVEHFPHPFDFLDSIPNLLQPGGTFIISTPRKPHGSPFHIVEFSFEEFLDALAARFKNVALYGQIYTRIFPLAGMTEEYSSAPHFNFIAVCSN